VDDSLVDISSNEWRGLLSREKKRRGLLDNKLVFIRARNLAQIAWCPMQAVRLSRRDEVSVFQTYVEDRLRFCIAASRISAIPSDRDQWLELAAADPPLAMVEDLLLPHQWQRLHYVGNYVETYAGDRSWAEPDIPSMAWQFSIAGYVIGAKPDGLTRSEVVEAKSARNSALAAYQRPVGELQADIYGVLFERKTKVLCVTVGDGEFVLERSPVRHDAVAGCLRMFSQVAGGWTPPAPREAWKCRNCEVNQGCPIRRT
jgi:hypothetical protein